MFFLKAASLNLRADAPLQGTISPDEVSEAVQAARPDQRPIFLLLDTLDLLLRDETARNALLLFVSALFTNGVMVIATSRPREFEAMSIVAEEDSRSDGAVLGFKRFDLAAYDEREFEEAVERHVVRFYGTENEYKINHEIARLQQTAISGLPVGELCQRPLTLRMLFVLYAPDAIPDEVHIFKLYSQFWDARVADDLRAGMTNRRQEAADLQFPAACLALFMLAEGRIELEKNLVRELCRRLNFSFESVEELIARDVMHLDESNRLRFFHQTFFEHSAARGFCIVLPEAAERFCDSVQWSIGDDFGAPVFEHLILLRLSGFPHERLKADARIKRLLTSSALAEQFSGVQIYAHSPVELPESAAAIATLLKEGKARTEFVDRYVRLLPNRILRVPDSVWQELSFLWSLDDWNIAIQILRLLVRLAKHYPKETAAFLEIPTRLNTKMARELKTHLLWEVLRVAKVVGSREPIWLWFLIRWMHRKQKKTTCTTDFLSELVQLACDCAPSFPRSEFVEYFTDKAMTQAADKQEQLSTKVAMVYGQAWSKIWEIENTAVTDIVAQIRDLSLLKLKPSLFGLARLLCSRGNEADSAAVLAAFDALEDNTQKSFWLLAFWPGIFRQFSLTGSSSARALIENAASRLQHAIQDGGKDSRDFIRWVADEDWRERFSERFAVEAVRILFQSHVYDDPTLWLEHRPLRSCLGLAALAGIPAARVLLDEIASGSRAADRNELNFLIVKITNQVKHDSWARLILLRLGIVWQDPEAIADGLERMIEENETSTLTPNQRLRIVQLAKSKLPRGSDRKELGDLRLRTCVAIEGWQSWPPWDQLVGELLETSNEERFRLLLQCVEEGVKKKAYRPNELLLASDDKLRQLEGRFERIWEDTLVRCLALADKLSKCEIDRTFKYFLLPGMGMERLKFFSLILTKAVHEDVSVALSMLEQFLCCPSVKALGRSANFSMSHRLQPSVSIILRKGGAEARTNIISLLPKISPIIGASFVHLICGLYYPGLLDDLERIYRSDSLDEFVRAMALRKREQRQGAMSTRRYEFISEAMANAGRSNRTV